MVGSAPSQPSPPKVIRQPSSQPVPRSGRVRAALGHLLRVEVAPVRGVQHRREAIGSVAAASGRMRERDPSSDRRRWSRRLRGGAGRQPARRRDHADRLRRARRLRGADRLRAVQDPDRHGRGDDRGRRVGRAGLRFGADDAATPRPAVHVDLPRSTGGCSSSPAEQSADIAERLRAESVELVAAAAGWTAPERVMAETDDGEQSLRRRRGPGRHRRPSARAARRRARRRADPHLDAGLRR